MSKSDGKLLVLAVAFVTLLWALLFQLMTFWLLYVLASSLWLGLGLALVYIVGLVTLIYRINVEFEKRFPPTPVKLLRRRFRVKVPERIKLRTIKFQDLHPSQAVQAELGVLLDVCIQKYVQAWYLPLTALSPRSPFEQTQAEAKARFQAVVIRKRYFSQIERPLHQEPSEFVELVDHSIRYAVQQLKTRAQQIDWSGFFSGAILPILTKHMQDFRQASSHVTSKGKRTLTQSEELNLIIAGTFRNGKLHPALMLRELRRQTSRDSPVSSSLPISTKDSEVTYLRRLLDQIIGFFMLPSAMASEPTRALVREIVVCVILFPVIEILSDPDYWNQVIDESATQAIEEQRMVHRLKEALEKPFEEEKQTLREKTPTFEEYLRSIRKCNNLLEAKRLRNSLLIEINKRKMQFSELQDTENKDHRDKLRRYINQLIVALKRADKRIVELGGSVSSGQQEVLESSDDSKHVSPTIEFSILLEEPGLAYFREFMDKEHHLDLLQFWCTSDAVLSALKVTPLVASDQDCVRAFLAHMAQIADDTRSKELEMLKEDLEMLVSSYFANTSTFVAREYPSDSAELVLKWKALMAMKEQTDEAYAEIVSLVFNIKQKVFNLMRRKYFIPFCHSETYFKWMADASFPHKEEISPAAAKLRATQVKDDSSIGNKSVNFLTNVFKPRHGVNRHSAVEIGANNDNAAGRMMRGIANAAISTIKAPIALGKDIFFHEEIKKNEKPALSIVVTPPTYTGDDVADIKPDLPAKSPQRSRASSMTSSQMVSPTEAVPEDTVKLVEEAFESIINNRQEEDELDEFVDEVVTEEEDFEASEDETDAKESGGESSAENATQKQNLQHEFESIVRQLERNEQFQATLAIMRKNLEKSSETFGKNSKINREIKWLDKMKFQYEKERLNLLNRRSELELQLSDNVIIPGKTKIRISTWEECESASGKPYASYIIEVFQDPAMKSDAGGWVISRRYSEFDSLHKLLKLKYPELASHYELPGKRYFHAFASTSNRIKTTLSQSTPPGTPTNSSFEKKELEFREERRKGLERYLQLISCDEVIGRSLEFKTFLCHDQRFGFGESGDRWTRPLKALRENIMRIPGQQKQKLKKNDSDNEEKTQFEFDEEEGTSGKLSEELKSLPFSAEAISQLVVELFDLHEKNNWWRRQATVWIFEQFIGGTLEKRISDLLKGFYSEERIVVSLNNLREYLTSVEPVPLRSHAQKQHTRLSVYRKLHILIPDLLGTIVGRGNAKRGSSRLFDVLQNSRLNQDLLYRFLDVLVMALIPENKGKWSLGTSEN